MNSNDVQMNINKSIKQFLMRSDNLEIFISLISRPHEVESRIWWKPVMRIDIKSPLLYLDYREFNLMRANNYYLYDMNKIKKLDYCNKNPELKNIYRSYNAVTIMLEAKNLENVLASVKDSHRRLIEALKESMIIENNACMEHVCLLLKTLLIKKPAETISLMVEENLFILMLEHFNN